MSHILSINLNSIVKNWRLLKSMLADGVDCGAVVKADAYGLGLAKVLPSLFNAGCRTFYVANLEEALATRELFKELPQGAGNQCRLVVLAGAAPGEEKTFLAEKITPVLVSGEMLCRWQALVTSSASEQPVSIVKINTGMGRLGLESAEFSTLLESGRMAGLRISQLMSHLACADEPSHPLNALQLQRFENALSQITAAFPSLRASLANSAGVFLGKAYHFDAVRPGVALYGATPQPGNQEIALQAVVSLRLPVIQVRKLPAGESVGYGATHRFSESAKLATIAGGYADGLLRSLANSGRCWVANPQGAGGWYAPVVGRISMDTTIVDISEVPDGVVQAGSRLEFIGEHIPLEAIASAAGTISYEILTSLGARYNRHYITR